MTSNHYFGRAWTRVTCSLICEELDFRVSWNGPSSRHHVGRITTTEAPCPSFGYNEEEEARWPFDVGGAQAVDRDRGLDRLGIYLTLFQF